MFDALSELSDEFVVLAAELDDAISDEDIGETSHVALKLRNKMKQITTILAEEGGDE